ncbi:gag-pol polyprotein, partial [Trifolium medium]|nr:gag-pol polyprotein [Trifolium medium]
WSDEEESEEEVESEVAKHVTALTGICMSDAESYDEELTYDELPDSYKELCLKSEEVCRTLGKQKKIIAQLQVERYDNLSKIDELHKKVNKLMFDLDEANKEVDKLNVILNK